MINFLAKIFIKDFHNIKDSNIRTKYGILCGFVGIFFNILLFALKFIIGFISKSVAITADAFNNLSDAAASIVTILGFRLSSKKPDADHPFGHGRIEYIAGLIISFLILLMGFELLKSSIETIFNPQQIETSFSMIIILVISIIIKLYMYLYNHNISKKIGSATMEATAKDSLNDTISTVVVLISVLVIKFIPQITICLDGFAGIFVACFILYGGYESLKETIDPLLGLPANSDFVAQIEQEVLKHQPICGIHDLIVHDYGPGRLFISLHAEVPGDKNIFDLHDVIDNAEKSISEQFGCLITIHMDPVDTNNKELEDIKVFLVQTANNLNENLSVHDIRMVPGTTHTNIIFDIVKPHNCKLTDTELKQFFISKIYSYNKYYNCVIQIDNPYV